MFCCCRLKFLCQKKNQKKTCQPCQHNLKTEQIQKYEVYTKVISSSFKISYYSVINYSYYVLNYIFLQYLKMTKRFGNFVDNTAKKLKTNLDDLWGDDLDLDDKDVDDVLLLASQVYEQKANIIQQSNVSILPSYNTFKQASNKKVFSSTQSDPNLSINLPQPSTSKITGAINKNTFCNGVQENGFKRTRSFDSPEHLRGLEVEIKKLQEDLIAKEGEISILRTQLKEIRRNNENDMHRKEKEWSEKLNATTKKLNAVKSELEFKNLEIANLKQKVVEVAKLNNLDASFSATQSRYFKQPKISERSTGSTISAGISDNKKANYKRGFHIQRISETCYPLQYAIPSSIFMHAIEEKYLIDVKNRHTCRNTIPFLQNQMSQELIEKIIRLQPKVILLSNNKQLGFDYIHHEVSKLMKCNIQEINAIINIICINKILMVSEQLLCNLHQFLEELKHNSEDEALRNVDTTCLETNFKGLNQNNSIFSTSEWCEKEMGINVKQSIAVIAEILPYNNYLGNYLLHKKSLSFNKNEEILKYLTVTSSKLDQGYFNNSDYLQLLNSIVTVIRKLKKADNFPGLLSAIAVLLNKICLCAKSNDDNGDLMNIVENVSHEILFSHPNIQVLIHFVEFLKNFPNNFNASYFCKMPSKKVLKIDQKEKVMHYNNDTCLIQVLCIFLENSISNIKDLKFFLYIMQFISSAIKQNKKWLHYMEDKYCECLCKIVKLCVDVIYQTVQLFCNEHLRLFCKEHLKNELASYKTIFQSGLKVLQTLSVREYDLIVKYIATHSCCKDIVISQLDYKEILNLSEETEVELLEDLNVPEEIPTLEEKSFDNITLWTQ